MSTSTHDTKRGEDARARLAVLSEMPEEWAAQVALWSRMIRAPQASTTEEMPPDRNDEYAFYQLLLAAWPPAFFSGALDPDAVAVFRLRIEGAMLKALREAKLRTTWAAPDEAYEQATLDFVRRALDTARANPFLESFQAFLARIAPLGVRNSLVQAVLKLTVPGVPDIYQGAELWDLSLVDPDNRRPIDFDCRRDALEDVKGRTNELSKLLKELARTVVSSFSSWRSSCDFAGSTRRYSTRVLTSRLTSLVRTRSGSAHSCAKRTARE